MPSRTADWDRGLATSEVAFARRILSSPGVAAQDKRVRSRVAIRWSTVKSKSMLFQTGEDIRSSSRTRSQKAVSAARSSTQRIAFSGMGRLLALSNVRPRIDKIIVDAAVDHAGKAIRCVDDAPRSPPSATALRELDRMSHRLEHHRLRLHVLQRIATRLRHPFVLAATPASSGSVAPKATSEWAKPRSRSAGPRRHRSPRGAFVRMEDYSLDALAREVLGEGKALESNAKDRLAEIIHNYRHNLPAFALYAALTPPRLRHRQQAGSDQASLRAQSIGGMTPDRVAASIASFDFVI